MSETVTTQQTSARPRAVRAITFDVSNTLLFPFPSLGALYAQAAARYGVRILPDEVERRFHAAWRRGVANSAGFAYGRNHAEAWRFWLAVMTQIFGDDEVSSRQIRAILDDLYSTFARPEFWRVHAAWPEVRRCCRARGVRLGLISNWDVRLRGLLRGTGLLADVEVVLISAEVGSEKPARAIFEKGLEAFRLPPEEVLHVGDSWSKDVRGCQGAGIHPVWYNPRRLPRPEADADVAVIADLAEILALVGITPDAA